jgi:uncharacterized membrane protein (UPF0136 family)
MTPYRTALVVTFFGLLTALGGYIGYLTAQSMPSLIAGSLVGFLLLVSGLSMMQKSVLGYFAACLLSAMMLFFFGYRFLNTGKLAPAGIMALISFAVFTLLILSKLRK